MSRPLRSPIAFAERALQDMKGAKFATADRLREMAAEALARLVEDRRRKERARAR